MLFYWLVWTLMTVGLFLLDLFIYEHALSNFILISLTPLVSSWCLIYSNHACVLCQPQPPQWVFQFIHWRIGNVECPFLVLVMVTFGDVVLISLVWWFIYSKAMLLMHGYWGLLWCCVILHYCISHAKVYEGKYKNQNVAIKIVHRGEVLE